MFSDFPPTTQSSAAEILKQWEATGQDVSARRRMEAILIESHPHSYMGLGGRDPQSLTTVEARLHHDLCFSLGVLDNFEVRLTIYWYYAIQERAFPTLEQIRATTLGGIARGLSPLLRKLPAEERSQWEDRVLSQILPDRFPDPIYYNLVNTPDLPARRVTLPRLLENGRMKLQWAWRVGLLPEAELHRRLEDHPQRQRLLESAMTLREQLIAKASEQLQQLQRFQPGIE